MNKLRILAGLAAVILCASLHAQPAAAQDAAVTPVAGAHTIITILPRGRENTPAVTPANVAVKVDGKPTPVSALSHFAAGDPNLQLVVLIDDSARSSLGLYFKEIGDFMMGLPPSVSLGVAYIENGGAHFVQPFTQDHALAVKSLHLPASPPGANASPYFALTSLVQAWPNQSNGKIRHEILLISNGVDGYGGLRYDPDNPYITRAIAESQKAGVIVYSIYFKDRGFVQRFGAAVNSGQNYLIQMCDATGGQLFYTGFENPVSFAPFLAELSRNFENQYEMRLAPPDKVKDGLQSLKVKINVPNGKVTSADHVLIGEAAERR